MLGDEEIKESSLIRPGDEIISIHEVCLTDKLYKKDMGFCNEPLFSSSSANELEVPRFLRDGFYPDGHEQQARFAWTEEDGNIASLVSDPGFGTSAQTDFGKDLDVGIKTELKEADTSSSSFPASNRYAFEFLKKTQGETSVVSSTNGIGKCNQGAYKIDKTDPRSRYHYVIYVKRHGRTVKLWECGICGREFQHQYTLMRHLPTHTDERNFHCSACGKSFRQLSTLSQHRAIHSAERPYSCEVCNKTFNRVSTLISHRKTHSEEKPYKCPICPKGFHQKGNLRNHLFTHTNERPYRCNICLKGFNQQSNLVCHKNKAHPDENCNTSNRSVRNITPTKTHAITESKADSSRSNDHCEVTSTVGPLSSSNTKDVLPQYFTDTINALYPWSTTGTGVVVDAIRTYHMGVALATRQTPFALLKPDRGNPVLVKVVDTKLPGGKQMLVPATAEDLRDGGKIIVKNEDCSESQDVVSVGQGEDALQIRVPVVATVVPRIQPSGRLRLCVEEPHRAYQSLSTEAGEINLDPCTNHRQLDVTKPLSSKVIDKIDDHVGSAPCINSSCSLPPPAPSPPLDLIPLDLFEPMECLPMGPQITAVDNVDQPPGSDDSDIFIGTFEESIPLSDSD